MKQIQIESRQDPVLVKTNSRVSEALLATQEKLLMACGGKGLCATCHVYVTAGGEHLSPRTPREQSSLLMLADSRPNSRLACQAKVLSAGAVVSLPKGQFIDGTKALEGLIGRRAEDNILHPLDGRVLIPRGKIITRSRIQELSFVDIDVSEVRTRSLTIDRKKTP